VPYCRAAMELRGRRVLITGASRGIGEALARRFADSRATVALVARSAPVIAGLAAELGGTSHPADLADPAQVATLVHRVEDEAGPVDVLVNNAALGVPAAITALTADDVRQTFQVNLVTPVELTRQVVPRMLHRGRGHVVNVSSLSGVGPFPGFATYAASKAGLTHFTAVLRADLKGLPVGTTVVELGPIPTEMLDGVGDYAPTAASFKRMYRLRLLADLPRDEVADETVKAVESGRRHVRLPKRAALFPLLAEAPRRMTEILLTGVKHQA
jgi:uncharacterized protein